MKLTDNGGNLRGQVACIHGHGGRLDWWMHSVTAQLCREILIEPILLYRFWQRLVGIIDRLRMARCVLV